MKFEPLRGKSGTVNDQITKVEITKVQIVDGICSLILLHQNTDAICCINSIACLACSLAMFGSFLDLFVSGLVLWYCAFNLQIWCSLIYKLSKEIFDCWTLWIWTVNLSCIQNLCCSLWWNHADFELWTLIYWWIVRVIFFVCDFF